MYQAVSPFNDKKRPRLDSEISSSVRDSGKTKPQPNNTHLVALKNESNTGDAMKIAYNSVPTTTSVSENLPDSENMSDIDEGGAFAVILA